MKWCYPRAMSRMASVVVALFAISVCARARTSRASAKDFQYGYIRAQALCTPEYGFPKWLHIASPVWTYCPYGPQPDYVGDTRARVEQAAQTSCLGKLSKVSVMMDGHLDEGIRCGTGRAGSISITCESRRALSARDNGLDRLSYALRISVCTR